MTFFTYFLRRVCVPHVPFQQLLMLIGCVATFCITGPLTAQTLALWDDDQPIDSTQAGATLAIGTQLRVGLTDTLPGVLYSMELRNEFGTPFVRADFETDPTGRILPTFLWQDVVPCHVTPDPTKLQFATYEAAELGLDGRSLTLALLADGQALGTLPIDFDVDLLVPRLYTAGGDGRPCTMFAPGSSVYVGGYHVQYLPRDLSLFFVGAQEAWALGDPLVEMRSEYATGPQLLTLAAGEDHFLELSWTGVPQEVCAWDIVFHPSPPDEPTYEEDYALGEEADHFCSGSGRGSQDPECMPCPPPV